jgi:hypothetical protein
MNLPKLGVRELGMIVPGDNLSASGSADPPAQAPVGAREPLPAASTSPPFVADTADGADLLGLDAPLAVLADLAVHARTETPLAIGLLGGPGSGKSSALRMLVRSITAASGSARNGSGVGTLGKVHVVAIDAERLDGTSIVALADLVHTSLADPYPALVGEAIHASRDPRLAAREAFEALDAARRKLSGERSALENEEARRAGLTEVVLFETAGTRIDAYARANRSRLKKRLAGLGVEGEPIRAFKQLVLRTMDGASARVAFVLRSFWAFKGQATLVVLAVLAVLAGLGLEYAEAERAAWLGQLRDADATRAAADWFEANIGLFETLRRILLIGAGIAVATNIFRALRLILPVFRAGTLLKDDLALRRQQADVEFGHETRRVESLAAEVDVLARRAAEADRRAAADRSGTGSLADSSPFRDNPRKRQAERFIAALGRLVASEGKSKLDAKGRAIDGPDRIVLALDGLDGLDPARARDILGAAHAAFGTSFVVLIAADPARLREAGANGPDSWIQVPFQVGELFARSDLSGLVRAMLEPKPRDRTLTPAPAESRVALDEPLSEAEAGLLAALAPLAGASPRAVKRFVNLYRLARLLCPDHAGLLALMLALDAGGTDTEIAAFDAALGSADGHLALDVLGAGPRLAEALASVRTIMGDESLAGARNAAETARLFSFGRSR